MGFNREKFKRTELLLGKDAMDRLEKSNITVIGLGAVGSHAIEALARSGVGTLRIVDFDEVGISNFNRQLLAVESNVGRLKTHAARERLLQINPDMTVEVFNTLCHKDTFDEVFEHPTHVVVDAIDSLNPKVNILFELVQRHMPVVSSMGAARRMDPTAITTGDISQTSACPLARSVRKRLRRMGVTSGIHTVYSTEVVEKSSVSRETEENFFNSGRQRNPMGSLPMISGIFGYIAALEAMKIALSPDTPV
ncbi:tRNA A37 threonylcarbamoyladenosine dehydratase [Desulfocicer vacuolatum DSM 3385]|uniref:tRNA A37 threonylcarbamoyladenosine dehydratase n=1 Tax=Desulfocicer vacuolatum DSM 3385 TaxID=1121400 RepID=A0A1W2B807_9BACT|nr:tRNA threonylcarbamoyladenosine dehydratase [Desulfocicer vacuolatum]SMC69069.1 tRNA A37 threonylcarbamoyladenosine dehydratase [Desulfocicer vacuolatum DSM 3385]